MMKKNMPKEWKRENKKSVKRGRERDGLLNDDRQAFSEFEYKMCSQRGVFSHGERSRIKRKHAQAT